MNWRHLSPVILLVGAVARPDAAYSDDLYQRARNACARTVGSSWEVARIDEARGIVHCKGPNRGRVVKVPFMAGKSKPRQDVASPADDPVPTTRKPEAPAVTIAPPPKPKRPAEVKPKQPAEVKPAETDQVEDPPLTTASPSGSGQVLRDQAKAYCVEHFGKGSTVDYIDYASWKVVCKRP